MIFAIPLSTVIEAVHSPGDQNRSMDAKRCTCVRPRAAVIRLAQEFDIPTDANRERFYVVVPRWETVGWGWPSMSFDPRRKW